MKSIEEKFYEATKSILENNLEIIKEPYNQNKVILVYDLDSNLSEYLANGYIKSLKNNKNAEIINFSKIEKGDLKYKLLNLKKNSTVILVQSTNFRLENFRIRMTLHKMGVGCLEHNHLLYIKEDEIENYADSIEYKTPYYNRISQKLKEICDNADKIVIEGNNGSKFELSGGFEDMKQNTGDYTGKNRGGTFPIAENFTEIIDFSKANGELDIYAYPGLDMQVNFVQSFKIQIKDSRVTCNDKNAPKGFLEILEMIKKAEDGEVMLRELGFGLNTGISRKKILSDVNSFERIAGFHASLGKKHGIYRKKYNRKIVQRYHIDIFSDTKCIWIDGKKIFENEKYLID